MRQSEEFKAFAAATVHDFFNLMAVGVLLPVELATGVLSTLAENISSRLVGSAGSEWKSPIKKWVKEPVGWLKDLGDAIGAAGNVLGTFLVIAGLVIILLSLACNGNNRQLVADRIEASLNRVLGTGAGMVAMV